MQVTRSRNGHYKEKGNRLMHEYTTIDPNIPVGSREDKMKLADWVLCEIYKKETDDSKQQVLSARNQHLDELSRRKRILMHHQESSYQTSASTHVFQQQVQSTYQDNQSIESNEDNFSFNDEELLEQLLDDDYADSLKPDYADSLKPGYRFCPTDSEMIVYYLQPKIETGEQHPKCRYHIANFCGDTPDNLADHLQSTPWVHPENILRWLGDARNLGSCCKLVEKHLLKPLNLDLLIQTNTDY
ncbi:NAC domain-containing protein [Tanacetum coccineum]|uniref:NAC domain-containing protein n=1 Tax=Tanacetum coccineum TaxID=301880 RepID=A0ABQ5DQH5_9ASTR